MLGTNACGTNKLRALVLTVGGPARLAGAGDGCEAGGAASDAGAGGELVAAGEDDGVLGAIAEVLLIPPRLGRGGR